MDSINYNHLFYFWTVAKNGSIRGASEALRVSQPTISEQVRKLEEVFGEKLFERVGRGLRLTEAGKMAFAYAEKMFSLSREMAEAMRGLSFTAHTPLRIGIAPAISKMLAHRLIAPALRSPQDLYLVCAEAGRDELYARLAVQELEIVLTDAVSPPATIPKVFHHLLRRSGIAFFSSQKTGRRVKQRFPACLDGADVLMPASSSKLYNALQAWFELKHLRPKTVAELPDGEMLWEFGGTGAGIFAAATILEAEIRARYDVQLLGRTSEIVQAFYAATMERRSHHAGIQAMLNGATRDTAIKSSVGGFKGTKHE